jgi:hypothetical protein
LKSLDEQISDIDKLDELRQRARQLRNEAIEALTAAVYIPRPRNSAGVNHPGEAEAMRPNWELPGDDIEKAEVLRALGRTKPKDEKLAAPWEDSRRNLLEDLQSITYADLTRTQALDGLPIFRAAVVLQALCEAGHALSPSALACFYRLVQELNEVSGPTWASGAARAGEIARATAFVTGECARALLAVETALGETAKAADLLAAEIAREENCCTEIADWRTREQKFRAASTTSC